MARRSSTSVLQWRTGLCARAAHGTGLPLLGVWGPFRAGPQQRAHENGKLRAELLHQKVGPNVYNSIFSCVNVAYSVPSVAFVISCSLIIRHSMVLFWKGGSF